LKNFLTCNSCNSSNPLYAYTCANCNAFLRARISNIDFWSVLGKLIESPVKAAEIIIQSDHKNFISIILFLSGLKFVLNLWILNNAFSINENLSDNFIGSIFSGIIFFILGIVLIAFVFKIVTHQLKIKTRFKDNVALYTYSFLPFTATLLVLSPVQIALFGFYWFSFNPSPIIIKELASYVIIFIEGLFAIWSFVLMVITSYAQMRNFIGSLFIATLQTIILSLSVILGFFILTGIL